MNDLVKISDLIGNAQQSHNHHSQSPELQDFPMQDLLVDLPTDDLEAGSEEAPEQLDPTSNICRIPPSDAINQHRDFYPGAARVYGKGHTFMDVFDADQFANERKENLYYPFASKQDWEIGSWLLRSGLSMPAIDQFLRLQLVRHILHRPL
jgi:hypothetical protein